jgi:hypothetical protein
MLPPYIRKRSTHNKSFIKTSNEINSADYERFLKKKNEKKKKGIIA